MIPAIISQMVVALKDTALGYVVAGVGLTRVAKQIYPQFQNHVPTIIVIGAMYVIVNLLLTWLAMWVQRSFVGEKKVLEVSMVGEGTPAPPSPLALSQRGGPLGHVQPDDALDDDGAVASYAAHPDAHVGVVAGPLLGVGLGDAGDVRVGLGRVGDLHPLGDPAPVARGSSPRRAPPSRPRGRCTARWRARS